MSVRTRSPLIALLALLMTAAPALAAPPAWLPHYEIALDLDVVGHVASGRMRATWTNMRQRPTDQLVFNDHGCYVVPPGEVGFMAKTLELLRVDAGEALGEKEPTFQVRHITLDGSSVELPFRHEGDTHTTLVVPLPHSVGPGESVTVNVDFSVKLPQKQGRWGQWLGVTTLSNWLPVFAVYDPDEVPCPTAIPKDPPPAPPNYDTVWRPTPFIPWHQPFYNESGNYKVRVTLPCCQRIACSGVIVGTRQLSDSRQEVDIEAPGVRDFALLCSAEYTEFRGQTSVGEGLPPVTVRVYCLPGHEHYAKEMVRIVSLAITRYSQWFGPYAYPEFTIAESYFGWNGNECSGLVMIDERVFAMPHLANGYVEYLVSHETCHQWWYNVVGTNGYCETWMDEAVVTFFSHKLLNERHGKNNTLMAYPAGLEWLPNISREDYRSYGMYGTFGRGENGPSVQPMDQFGHVANLFSMCYDKGSRIVGMMEERVGGETAFISFMRGIYSRYQYRILRVADLQRELETHIPGRDWPEFFKDWLYGPGISDWAVGHVEVYPPPTGSDKFCWSLADHRRKTGAVGPTRVVVHLKQKGDCDVETCLGFAFEDQQGYPLRVPILPTRSRITYADPPVTIEPEGPHEWRVEIELPEEPVQITVDPDQVLVDRNPANNYWRHPFRWRVTPVYTFLEETDLTNAYDRWNLILGPWVYGTANDDAWYTRSTMFGVRAGLYRTQEFNGGVYVAYRDDFRDIVAGVDAVWQHWPDSHWEIGFNAERRLVGFEDDDRTAFRSVLYSRYIFQYGSSLYLEPMQYMDFYASYQDNFLPNASVSVPGAERYSNLTTAGIHYRLDYLTPYWDPEGGFKFDIQAEGGEVGLEHEQGVGRMSAQLSTVHYLPDLSGGLANYPILDGTLGEFLRWLAQSRVAVRGYGATGLPSGGEYFTMGGSALFRGYDMGQRQGSSVWVGSAEWRVPLLKGITWDFCDHVLGARNLYGALFYDVGDAYALGHEVGPIAHGVGAGLRLDVAWFGFVERSTLRMDVAKALNDNTPVQFWIGVGFPF